MSRVNNSVRNVAAALVGQFFGLIISFISRIVFIRILGAEFLGVNGLFANILTVLSLAELGVGEAITFSLYKPLAKKDEKKCIMLMQLYKRIYTIIGIVIIVLGVILLPFLPHLINGDTGINNLSLIFILFVLNTAVSYFFSYKRNLIIADQKRYIATIYKYAFYFIVNLAQIIYLLVYKHYIGFLIIQIMCTIIENIFVSLKANKLYPFLKHKERISLDKTSKKEITKNTKAMLMHKVGGIVISSTDNIILSKYVSLVSVGLYSNYYMITNALNVIYGQIYSSIMASIGNLCVDADRDKQYDIFCKIYFFGFWISCFTSICLLCLINPFIEIWLGKKFLFGFDVVLILVANFYVYNMRKAVLTFREAAGLFYYDRWKAVVEAIINIVTSIILAIKLGVFGVFLGTIISSITVCVWVEPYVLYKYGFHRKLSEYFKKYIPCLILFLLISTTTYFICSLITVPLYSAFLIKMVICMVVPNAILYIIYRNSNEFFFFKRTTVSIVKKVLIKLKKRT